MPTFRGFGPPLLPLLLLPFAAVLSAIFPKRLPLSFEAKQLAGSPPFASTYIRQERAEIVVLFPPPVRVF